MFAEGFVFKKTDWHVRLMKYIWGFGSKEFTHMCPYFWLSVFNVVISPVVLPIKFTIKTIIPRLILYPLWSSLKWVCNGLERHAKKMAADYNKYCLRQQEKQEQERLNQLMSMDEVAIERIRKGVEPHVFERLQEGVNPNYLFSWPDEVYQMREGRKKERMKEKWREYWDTFIKLHQVDPKTWDKVVEKTKEVIEVIAPKVIKTEPIVYATVKTIKKELTEEEKAILQAKEEKEKIKLQIKEAKEKRRFDLLFAKNERKAEKKRLRDIAKNERRIKRNEILYMRKIHRQDVVRRNKEKINKILKIAKPIGKIFIWIVGIAVAGFGLYLLYRGFIFTGKAFSSIPHKTYVHIGYYLKWILVWGIALAILCFIVWGLILFFKWIDFSKIKLPKIKLFGKIGKSLKFLLAEEKYPEIVKEKKYYKKRSHSITINIPLKRILFIPIWNSIKFVGKIICRGAIYSIYPFKWIIKGSITFLKIIKTTYNNNCPPLKIED